MKRYELTITPFHAHDDYDDDDDDDNDDKITSKRFYGSVLIPCTFRKIKIILFAVYVALQMVVGGVSVA